MKHAISICFSAIVITALIASCNRKVIDPPYCEMYKTDQSHVNTDKSNIVQFNTDRNKRISLIEKNFDILIEYSKRFGFPKIEPNLVVTDSCKYWAVTMTMIHTAQINPELFFSKKMVAFFNKELERGNLQRSLLKQCIEITHLTTTPTEDLTSTIDRASLEWGLKDL